MNNKYYVKPILKPINKTVVVPGSKSMTNRALLMAALSDKRSTLKGVLFSDDSRHFLGSLQSLGYEMNIDEPAKTVSIKGTGGIIPNKTGTIDVGSAGTAARFLTAMLALSEGEYTINCSEQMKRRPMKQLFDILTYMGAEFTYLENEGFLPVKVKGCTTTVQNINMDISSSTQYLSAMLMIASCLPNGLGIRITSEKTDGSYIRITRYMMKEFGVESEFDGTNYFVKGNQNIDIQDYYIEPDVSGACYFYALAAMTGSSITVKNVFRTSVQGDMKFLNLLEDMGCKVTETESGINITGSQTPYSGIDINMNDFSDQALTLAAMAPYATSDTTIRGIAHIRGQECDRINAIVNELSRVGIRCESTEDSVTIHPGTVKPATITTYDDHRVAMAFSLLGLKSDGIIIDDPGCCRKTFENYFDVLDSLYQ